MQGFLPKLLIETRAAFPGGMLYTPRDHGGRNASDWPSMAELVANGKRVMVVSGADYGADAADVLFTRPDVCNWQVLTLHPTSLHTRVNIFLEGHGRRWRWIWHSRRGCPVHKA